MTAWDWLRAGAIFGPIGAMLILGLVLALRSGVARLATPRGARLAFENLSSTLLVLAGSLLGMAIIQHLVGLHVGRIW